jgi:hypothetical protein
MIRYAGYILISVLVITVCSGTLPASGQSAALFYGESNSEPSSYMQLLNGRIWHNRYAKAQGDPYYLSDEFLKGSVTFNGVKYSDLDLRFDICNDELILRTENRPIIIMNKEMVDSFSLYFEGRIYRIINSGNDPSGILKGYVNVLYAGRSELYAKYTKIIYPLGADGRYDLFHQAHSLFFVTESGAMPVKGKRALLKLLEAERKEINAYLRNNRVRITWKDPYSFIPVVKHFDNAGR